jgi:hypothetical protein
MFVVLGGRMLSNIACREGTNKLRLLVPSAASPLRRPLTFNVAVSITVSTFLKKGEISCFANLL